MRAWNNWYHCTGSTYGAWLPGDPRGWRSVRHRVHVDGDYKSPPPPGKYEKVYQRSRELMKRVRVALTAQQRRVACRVMAEALLFHGVELVELCVGAKHYHILARFQPLGSTFLTKDRSARRLIGIAKKRSARALSDAGLVDIGGVWGTKCRVLPVKDRAHQLQIVRYIRKHARKGAAVWSLVRSKPGDCNPQA